METHRLLGSRSMFWERHHSLHFALSCLQGGPRVHGSAHQGSFLPWTYVPAFASGFVTSTPCPSLSIQKNNTFGLSPPLPCRCGSRMRVSGKARRKGSDNRIGCTMHSAHCSGLEHRTQQRDSNLSLSRCKSLPKPLCLPLLPTPHRPLPDIAYWNFVLGGRMAIFRELAASRNANFFSIKTNL